MMNKTLAFLVRFGFVALFAMAPGVSWGAPLTALPPSPPVPSGNLQTDSKVALGKALFFDPRLSVNGSISCAFCHVPTAGYADPKPVSFGVGGKRGGRNAPSVLNAAYFPLQFWDGRAGSLEEQAIGPLTNPVEMANPNYRSIVLRLNKVHSYRVAFYRVFGAGVSVDRIARAIASFERTLVTPNSPYDRYMMGEKNALTASQKRGLAIFQGKGRCVTCHNGFLLSDKEYHNLGVPQSGTPSVDVGRYVVTHDTADKGRFRTPSLRNVALTAPYMHDGVFRTLNQVVDFYDRGGGKTPFAKDALIVPLHLSKREKADLISFLQSLSGETAKQKSFRASHFR
ncbi:MAG: cytochrome-c peroxidase [Leptospirales bacterium]